MTDPVHIHLKDIYRGRDIILKQVVDLKVEAEGAPLGIEGDSPEVGDVAAMYVYLCSAEITDERTLVGRWNMVHESGDCGEFF